MIPTKIFWTIFFIAFTNQLLTTSDESYIENCIIDKMEDDLQPTRQEAYKICKGKFDPVQKKAKICIADLEDIIPDLGPIPQIHKTQKLPVLMSYLQDILFFRKRGCEPCKRIKFDLTLNFIREFLLVDYRMCFIDSLYAVYKTKELVSLWNKGQESKVREELDDYIFEVVDAFETCKWSNNIKK